MRILVTNDDGIFAEGIYVLAKSLQDVGEVIVVAPNTERSAVGHGITMHHPLRMAGVRFFDTSIEAYSVNGTPADCIKIAIEVLLKDRKPTVVVSGINNGPNLGTDVLYSGTVSAAVEAAILDLPSIAVSMATSKIDQYNHAAEFICKLLSNTLHIEELSDTIINVNYPTIAYSEIKGVKVTNLGIRKYENAFIERLDPRGNAYYWISGKAMELAQDHESDVQAINDNYISITPIHFDLTHFKSFKKLKNLNLEK
ncbi:stationary-phase survival protein SurE [Alkaliphilus metalliredigens QYMF]|uniref:5'-nucleotidase SurE n=1 Tax=Alkaliphilus metalliredigens (strain QYMF) TaxID=293826 RepID=SURE_ALKMQ|nr:5'/3'-nucleotidase SurE [Alkaliphilus metalliredigens]A6TRH0.1 RecName: Full=5'-nucleotidase SurE; AltName: Full=Nucleoside 5'-monophosphate phosphohydrolase [Alkaliphilus metalliredigens QYMF]ABR48788.1 stationary-phase survival protein SurE [Alkaliphilus metalliredigens QYMF]